MFFPSRFNTWLAQINPFSHTKHLLAQQRWWRNTLTLSDNITVLFESLGIVCTSCFTVSLRVLIHGRLHYLCVLCVRYTLICVSTVYRLFIESKSNISHCLEREKKKTGKCWLGLFFSLILCHIGTVHMKGIGLKGSQPAVFGAGHLGPRRNSKGTN